MRLAVFKPGLVFSSLLIFLVSLHAAEDADGSMVFRVSTGDDYDKLEKSIADQNMTIGRLPLNIEGPAGVSLKSMVLENGSTWLCISVKNDSRIIDRLELIIMDQRVAAQFPQPTDSYIFRPIRSISLYRGGEYSVRFTTYEKLGLKQENHRN